MRVSVDEDRCRGHGMCLTACPEVFTLADGGYAEVLLDEVPDDYVSGVRDAVEWCPEQAISITEGD
ncbi:ferredoxin [Mycolicibacterium fluoranthenivorans]|uniref:Ferredoxin n=1 Tax=Mycolicibacterium fluoranthenivorans TaxID=258505 RepID=A0A1G4V3Q3_9MYCO|nr:MULTISPECIES: ferredoxin [Mycobacteriaceae]MCV7255107.1 ferredoxin [Mycobacterium hackensackense]MCV7359632.1 ferredoxin [Mycolicibacterium fluoranthenivorans]NIH96835.1 ferredoxin [Mycolicibacterium fluoranthenivorans]QNJ91791.1 ferredoxin [Mycolicibacterium fluoranthenivorans]SCX00737.1 ferredoxin [Mycolicibacterium fluoranthenivorans]